MAYKQSITTGNTIKVTASYPAYDDGSYHSGLDTVHTDLKAYAPSSGVVVRAYQWSGGTTGTASYGNHIIVDMGNGNFWVAAHFEELLFSVGDTIAKGQFIGVQGLTGNVTGKHTHWEYRVGGNTTANRQDPSLLLGIPNAVGVYDVEWDSENPPDPPDPPIKKRRRMPVYMMLRYF